jgi:hypothetical protein
MDSFVYYSECQELNDAEQGGNGNEMGIVKKTTPGAKRDDIKEYMLEVLAEFYKNGKVHTCYSASGVPYEVITVSDYREVTERSRE